MEPGSISSQVATSHEVAREPGSPVSGEHPNWGPRHEIRRSEADAVAGRRDIIVRESVREPLSGLGPVPKRGTQQP
jgi:hypothetical protein